ncbi:AAA family ATPase [uncultured Cohaesibacter sp.]|uniref:AAA family ATPase n=1 Tax=uncultured Cohaesibacter sp. TaxID=1002546 RepID=UPI002AA76767|nr:AAA family ATPase [uncultured Cohaesibacter sp.]
MKICEARVIVLTGPTSVGKTTTAFNLVDTLGASYLSTSELIKKSSTRTINSRRKLQDAGDKLDRETNHSWIAEEVRKQHQKNLDLSIIVDAPRVPAQIAAIEKLVQIPVCHIHLNARASTIRSRYSKRNRQIDLDLQISEIQAHITESWHDELSKIANLCVWVDGLSANEVSEKIEKYLQD